MELPGRPDPPPATASGILLFGVVYSAAATGELLDSPSVTLVDRRAERRSGSITPDGGYSFTGIAPGRYWIQASAKGLAKAERVLDLDGSAAQVRCDLELLPAAEIRVRVVDFDGRPVRPTPTFVSFAVATFEPLGEWLDPFVGDRHADFGVGRFHDAGEAPTLPPPYWGRVELDVASPVYLSLLHYHHVLATRVVEPGQDEVEFVLDAGSPLLSNASLRFRLVDRESGLRIPRAKALVLGVASRALPESEGVFGPSSFPSGWYDVVANTDGYETARQRVLLEPGAEVDLGDIALERELAISGRVVAHGKRLPERIDFAELDPATSGPLRQSTTHAVQPARDGTFRIPRLSRRTYVLSIHGPAKGIGSKCWIVDLSAGSVENLMLELAQGVPLFVSAADERWQGLGYRVFGPNDVALVSCELTSSAPAKHLLAPGSYLLVATRGGVETRRIAFEIAREPVDVTLP